MPAIEGFATAFDAFRATAEAYPGNTFFCAPARAGRDYYPEGVEFSYGAALVRILELRDLYRRSGIGYGHRVALLLGSRPEHFFHLFALNALGASVVPINPESTPDEMLYALDHSEADLAIAAPSRLADLQAVARRCVHAFAVHSAADLPERFATPAKPAVDAVPGRATEATLLYTSGTTGKPKGCMISNEYFLASGAWYFSRGGKLAMRFGEERLFNPFPVFHMNAGVMALMGLTLSANCLVLADRFHPTCWWRDVVATRATAIHYMGVVPPMLLKQAECPEERLHDVRFGLGAGIDPALHPAFEARFGFPLVEVWGMTETGRIFCDNTEPRRVTTRAFGRPTDGLEAMIADDQDQELPRGTPGNFLVRFAGLDPRRGFFSGYLKDPAATEAAWCNGWFHTGDMAMQDEDGMLYFVDRKKNIIRRSGENIAAAEIEAVIITHPGVLSVAVLPIEDELREEEVMACIVARPGVAADRALADAVLAHCRPLLAYYKLPGWIVFRDTLPTTSTTKIQKTLIFAAGEDPKTGPASHDFRHAKRRGA